MFSSWWSVSWFSWVFFEWVEGGNKSSKLSSGGGTTDLTGLHIESNWSSLWKMTLAVPFGPPIKVSTPPPLVKKWWKIATSKILVIPMTLECWLGIQNVSMKAYKSFSCARACLVLLVGHSSRLAVANSSFHHQQHLVFVAHLLRFSRHGNRLVQTLWTINYIQIKFDCDGLTLLVQKMCWIGGSMLL